MMNKYLIKLTPIGRFFFGGEMTFKLENEKTRGNNKETQYNERYSSYIIESNQMPQQTSLLGMLRFLILRNAGKSIFDDNQIQQTARCEVERRIGQKSFAVNNDTCNDFGWIKSISPCFIMDGNSPLKLPVRGNNFDFHLESGELVSNDDFSPKKELTDDSYSHCFTQDIRTGLLKEKDGLKRSVQDDDALFKQISLQFNKIDEKQNHHDYKFAFFAEIDSDDNNFNLEDYTKQSVSLGADSSIFSVEIEKKMDNKLLNINGSSQEMLEVEWNHIQTSNTVVLTSPAFIDSANINANAAITNVISFRFMTTNIDMKKDEYYHVSRRQDVKKEKKSGDKYNLYDRGSIFFFEDIQKKTDFMKELDKHKDFKQIGYNHYITN